MVDPKKYPIYSIFKKINFSTPHDIIKFNLSNEFAVDLFKKNRISYTQIPQIIKKCLSYELNASINSIGSIINYQNEFNKIIMEKNENI